MACECVLINISDFEYMINYTCDPFNGTWQTLGPFTETIIEKNRRMRHVLKDLPYAHMWYDVRIALKSSTAPDIPEMWSNYTSIVFQTGARTPDHPPQTNIGAFSISANTGQITIYWKALPEYEYNGDRFGYFVTSNPLKDVVWPTGSEALSMGPTSAKIPRIDGFTQNKALPFFIYSNNSVGHSPRPADLRIPAKNERLEEPYDIKKIRKQAGYEILWTAPTNNSQITSYTVFWCEPNKELPNECSGPIDFKVLSRNTFMFNFTTSTMYNFAISANSNESSSGMVWAMCTHGGGEINKMSGIFMSGSASRSIEYTWNLDCVDRTVLTKYELRLCSVNNPKEKECIANTTRNYSIPGSTKSYKVQDLTPYSIYRMTIRMISNDLAGPWSEPIDANTLEGAPSAPTNLRVFNIENTTATLEWRQPVDINGVLTKYAVSLNGKETSVEIDGPVVTYNVTGLESFANYSAIVVAWTVAKSLPSNAVEFQTRIGNPSRVDGVRSDDGVIEWNKPQTKSGHVQYYELQLDYSHKGQTSQPKIHRIPYNKCTLRRRLCDINGFGSYKVKIRAVNVLQSAHANEATRLKYGNGEGHVIVTRDLSETHRSAHQKQNDPLCLEENDEHHLEYLASDSYPTLYGGEWSTAADTSCDWAAGESNHIYLLIFLLVFGSVFAYGSFFVYDKLRGMGKIQIKIPDGLEDGSDMKTKTINDDSNSIKVVLSDEQTDRLLKNASLSSEENDDGGNSTDETISETIETDKVMLSSDFQFHMFSPQQTKIL